MFSLVTPAEGSVRQHPWLTYLLAAGLLVAFAVQHVGGQSARDGSAASVAAARDYFQQNPMVALDPRFEVVLGQDWVQQTRQSHAESLRGGDRPLLSGFLPRRTQERFDELEQQALVEQDALPASRHGVAGRDTPAPNFLAHTFVNEGMVFFALTIFFLLCAGAAVECAWGSLLFSVLCTASVGAAAWTAASLYNDLSPPWVGAQGLIAGLLGASLVASLRRPPQLLGALPLPGWLLLPLWSLAYVSRLGGIPALDSAALIAPSVAAGVGLTTAVVIGLLLPSPRKRAAGSSKRPNRVLEHARRASATGQHARAFDLLSAEYRRAPEDPEVALAFWEASRDNGMPNDGREAIRTVLADRVKRGLDADLVTQWLDVVMVLPDIELEPKQLLRIAQALLEEGQSAEALKALERVVERPEPVSAALALRVTRIARDLDPKLAQRAAAVALADPAITATDRADLHTLLAASEHAPGLEAACAQDAASSTPNESASLARIQLVRKASRRQSDPASVPDDASPWVDQGLVEDLSAQLADVPSEPAPEWSSSENPPGHATEWVNATAPSRHDPLFGDALEVPGPEALDAFGDERTVPPDPLAFDQLDEDMIAEVAPTTEEAPQWSDPGLLEDSDDELCGDTIGMLPNAAAERKKTVGPQPASLAAQEAGDARLLKLIPALPLSLEESGIALELEERGKLLLTWDRVDALAAAAVNGIGEKPILVIDIVLNWMSLTQEPLKVIRLRSDLFNPRLLVPGAPSSLEALRALLAAIFEASGATPLPDADAARGRPFSAFATLLAYEQTVLMVDGESRD